MDQERYKLALAQIQTYAKQNTLSKFSVAELTFIATARFLGTDATGKAGAELNDKSDPISLMIARTGADLPYDAAMRAAVLDALKGVDTKGTSLEEVKAGAALAKTSVQALALKGQQTINVDPDKAATLIDALPADAAQAVKAAK